MRIGRISFRKVFQKWKDLPLKQSFSTKSSNACKNLSICSWYCSQLQLVVGLCFWHRFCNAVMFSCTFPSFKASCDQETKAFNWRRCSVSAETTMPLPTNVIASRHDRSNRHMTVDFMFYKSILYSRVSQVR